MNRFQLATLVDWAGTLNTRKRLQKVVFLLQAAGCELKTDFILHHYGPYSQELASLTDTMVQSDLLCEEKTPNMAGSAYSYRLSDRAKEQLKKPGNGKNGGDPLGPLAKHQELAKRLLDESSLPKLEMAATVAYFFTKSKDKNWSAARSAAAKFKNQKPSSRIMVGAEELAQEVVRAGKTD